MASFIAVIRYALLETFFCIPILPKTMPIFIFSGILGIVLKIYTHVKLYVPLEYQFDEEAKLAYENLCSVWMSMNKNDKFWQTISEHQINKKISGGAQGGVSRIKAKAINKLPYYVKANVSLFGLQLRKQQVFFLPDKLLVISGRKVGAINYSDISMGLGTVSFVETESIPKDAKVIRQTWLKVNKDGSPDKRYNGNRQVPVCEYGAVQITSGTILNIELMCSNSATIERMRYYAKQVFK